MDRDSLIGPAREFVATIADGTPNEMHLYASIAADFAHEQIAAAVRAERERVADELERITNGSSCEVNRLICELRGEI